MQCFNADESVIDVSIGSHEEPGLLDYNLSYYSDVPVGYVFARGPNVYASEAGGTTFYVQEAIPLPVLSPEHPNVIDYPVSSSSAAPVGYQFFRGPNIYSTEIGGTSFFLQEAIPNPVLSSSELIESSNLSDISHPSLPTSSVVLDHENIESSNSAIRNSEGNGKVEQIHSVKSKEVFKSEKNKIIKTGVKNREAKPKQLVDYTCSVKTEVVCVSELNEKEKTLKSHKISVESDEFSNIELNKKMKQKPDNGPVRDRNSVENINYVTYADVLKSNIHRSAEKSDDSKNSYKSDKMYNIKDNKLIMSEIKKYYGKKNKVSRENENFHKSNDASITESHEKLQKVDRHKTSVENDGISNLELNEKIKPKTKKSKKQDKNSEDNTSATIYVEVFNPYNNASSDKLDDSKSFVKDDKVCDLGKNKKNKRKVKKRNTKVTKSDDNKNNDNSTKSIITESYENFQQTKENKRTVTNNELYSLEVNVKDEKSQEDKLCVRISEDLNLEENTSRQELKKGKTQFEKSAQNNNFTISSEVSITELNEGSKNTDKYKSSHELCSLEASKTTIKKCKKRKTKGTKNIEHECSIKGNEASTENNSCAKSNEDSYTELNGNFQKIEERKSTVKPRELCNLQEVKTHQRKFKKRKKRGKQLVKHSSLVENEAPNCVLNANINKRYIQKEECDLDVNEEIKQAVEYKMVVKSPEDSNLDANKKKENAKKMEAKDSITMENKTVNVEEVSDLNSSNKHPSEKEEHRLISTEINKFSNNNEESSIVEKYDTNKTIEDFQEANIKSQYFSEHNASNAVREEREKIKCNSSSSTETFHSNSKAFFELLDPKEVCVEEKSNLKAFDQVVLTYDEKSPTTKRDESPNKKCYVPSLERKTPADVLVAVPDLQEENSSISGASIEVKAAKKKRFQRLRKWFNGMFCCVRKNKK